MSKETLAPKHREQFTWGDWGDPTFRDFMYRILRQAVKCEEEKPRQLDADNSTIQAEIKTSD